jgi:hypothetical protein
MIIIKCAEIFRYNIPFFVHQQWSLQMEDAHVVKTVSDNKVDLPLHVCGVVNFIFVFLPVDLSPNPLTCCTELFI